MSLFRHTLYIVGLLSVWGAHTAGAQSEPQTFYRSELRAGGMRSLYYQGFIPNSGDFIGAFVYLGYRYRPSACRYWAFDIDITDQADRLRSAPNYVAYSMRSYFAPTLGYGLSHRWRSLEFYSHLGAGARILIGEGVGAGSGGGTSSGGWIGVGVSSTSSSRSVYPTARLRIGAAWALSSKISVFADAQFGVDLLPYDPNINLRIEQQSDTTLQHFGRGSVRNTYAFGTVGLAFRLGKPRS